MTRPAALPLAAALLLATVSGYAADLEVHGKAGCAAPPTLMAIGPAQPRSAARIEQGETLTIVAVGSSSTQGVGASASALSYPSRLEAELKDSFPSVAIRVINRGKGGEDVAEELTRLDRDVI